MTLNTGACGPCPGAAPSAERARGGVVTCFPSRFRPYVPTAATALIEHNPEVTLKSPAGGSSWWLVWLCDP